MKSPDTPVRVTPGMRQWCRRLRDPEAAMLVKNTKWAIDVSCVGTLSHGSPNYVMAAKLSDAGLIEWVENNNLKSNWPYKAVLTEDGMYAAAGK